MANNKDNMVINGMAIEKRTALARPNNSMIKAAITSCSANSPYRLAVPAGHLRGGMRPFKAKT